MTERLFAATRKGLIEFHKSGAQWDHAKTHFIGEPASNFLVDPRDNCLYAAWDLGHFGVKLH